jgi:splicing factor 3A subunit 3
MVLEEQRLLHEDLERLEQAIADRVLDDPKHVSEPIYLSSLNKWLISSQIRDRLNRDHQIANFLERIEDQSKRLLSIYKDGDKARDQEIQSISTGDPFEEFYKQYSEMREFHKRYPNEPVENLERAYKRKVNVEGEPVVAMEIDGMFSGEEGFGRFFDLTTLHEQYLNLPGIKGARRLTYLQYLDAFDKFSNIKHSHKMTEEYFQFLGALMSYLESFIRKIRPLEDLEKLFRTFDQEFEKAWELGEVAGWTQDTNGDGKSQGPGEGIWCDDCEKEFKNPNVYQHHLTQKKHLRAVEAKKSSTSTTNGASAAGRDSIQRLKEKAIAEREFRIQKLGAAMQIERSDTKVNVERRQGMTERERAQELENLMTEQDNYNVATNNDGESDSDGEEDIQPLKTAAWMGRQTHPLLAVQTPWPWCGILL